MVMEKEQKKDREKIQAVLQILKKQASLTIKQEKFCNDGCVERFLKAKGDSVKKAAKHLRAVLSWRDSIGTDHLIADEFSAELAEGAAYVAGHDDDSRPVLVFRLKQDFPKTHTQKSFVRLVVFTVEVAISSMSRFAEQFVLIFDAGFFRSASACLSLAMATLKIVAEQYPGRLHRSFIVDPPSIFPYLWKGARPFVEHWAGTTLISSIDFEEEDSLVDEALITSHPRASSFRGSATPAAGSRRVGASTSSRFSFTVSGRVDSLKPWYLNTLAEPPDAAAAATSPSLVGVSPLNARSYSFASPAARSSSRSVPATPLAGELRKLQPAPRTPRPSFLQSPASALFSFRRDATSGGGGEKKQQEEGRGREAFVPFVKFYRKPYDEKGYRGMMRPPLGGLVSIVSPLVMKPPKSQTPAKGYRKVMSENGGRVC